MKQTKKLRRAIEILASERYADTSPDEFLRLMRRRRVTAAQVYAAVKHFGYRWNGREWAEIPPLAGKSYPWTKTRYLECLR
ncbi:MAG: hypothetical protein D6743_14715 [Calditrichaeota bacterium]|nr:MAG: hypothetical protein D6743_14715 [Calditrichota bacterium]